MFTQQHCREQVPGLVKRLNGLIAELGSPTIITFSIADGFYDIIETAPNGKITLLAGSLSPMEAWRRINLLITFTRMVMK